jgi:hypothetical protein
MNIKFLYDVEVTWVSIPKVFSLVDISSRHKVLIKEGATPTIESIERGEKRKQTRLNKLYGVELEDSFNYLEGVPEDSYVIMEAE